MRSRRTRVGRKTGNGVDVVLLVEGGCGGVGLELDPELVEVLRELQLLLLALLLHVEDPVIGSGRIRQHQSFISLSGYVGGREHIRSARQRGGAYSALNRTLTGFFDRSQATSSVL
jgi:hypothetical protein